MTDEIFSSDAEKEQLLTDLRELTERTADTYRQHDHTVRSVEGFTRYEGEAAAFARGSEYAPLNDGPSSGDLVLTRDGAMMLFDVETPEDKVYRFKMVDCDLDDGIGHEELPYFDALFRKSAYLERLSAKPEVRTTWKTSAVEPEPADEPKGKVESEPASVGRSISQIQPGSLSSMFNEAASARRVGPKVEFDPPEGWDGPS